jgi:hypothetical protein
MTDFKFISRFIGLSSELATSLFPLRRRGTASPNLQMSASSAHSEFKSHRPTTVEGDSYTTWPPPEGMYWGM